MDQGVAQLLECFPIKHWVPSTQLNNLDIVAVGSEVQGHPPIHSEFRSRLGYMYSLM